MLSRLSDRRAGFAHLGIELCARTERPAFRGQDDRATRGILVQCLERLSDLPDQAHIEIVVGRPANLDDRDQSITLNTDILERLHGAIPHRELMNSSTQRSQ